MSKPKIVFSDIDGTLLNADRVLSQKTIKEFQRIKNNTPIVLISSRMPKAMRHLQNMSGISQFPIIAYNGGLILINNNQAFSLEIENTVLKKMISYNSGHKIHYSLYNNDDWYVPKMDYWVKREINNTKVSPEILPNIEVLKKWEKTNKGAHKIMCMGNVDDIDHLYKYLEENFSEQLNLYRSKSTYIEIASAKISKKTAVEFLLESEYSNLSIAEAVAFGDNYNDIEMLQAVGFGVAVANAKVEVKSIAKYETSRGDQDGVALFIEQNID